MVRSDRCVICAGIVQVNYLNDTHIIAGLQWMAWSQLGHWNSHYRGKIDNVQDRMGLLWTSVRLFNNQAHAEFFRSRFNRSDEFMLVVNGMLSAGSSTEMVSRL